MNDGQTNNATTDEEESVEDDEEEEDEVPQIPAINLAGPQQVKVNSSQDVKIGNTVNLSINVKTIVVKNEESNQFLEAGPAGIAGIAFSQIIEEAVAKAIPKILQNPALPAIELPQIDSHSSNEIEGSYLVEEPSEISPTSSSERLDVNRENEIVLNSPEHKSYHNVSVSSANDRISMHAASQATKEVCKTPELSKIPVCDVKSNVSKELHCKQKVEILNDINQKELANNSFVITEESQSANIGVADCNNSRQTSTSNIQQQTDMQNIECEFLIDCFIEQFVNYINLSDISTFELPDASAKEISKGMFPSRLDLCCEDGRISDFSTVRLKKLIHLERAKNSLILILELTCIKLEVCFDKYEVFMQDLLPGSFPFSTYGKVRMLFNDNVVTIHLVFTKDLDEMKTPIVSLECTKLNGLDIDIISDSEEDTIAEDEETCIHFLKTFLNSTYLITLNEILSEKLMVSLKLVIDKGNVFFDAIENILR